MTSYPSIVCDLGERASGIPERLAERGVEIEMRRLRIGDYLVGGRYAVERKGRDLADSILSGRIYRQLDRLADAGASGGLVLIEGDSWSGDRRLRAPMLARLYDWIATQPRLAVAYSPSDRYTARLLVALAKSPHVPKPAAEAMGPRIRTSRDVLLAFPGVGPRNADHLCRVFPTIGAVLQASRAELQGALGPVRGTRLYEILNAPLAPS